MRISDWSSDVCSSDLLGWCSGKKRWRFYHRWGYRIATNALPTKAGRNLLAQKIHRRLGGAISRLATMRHHAIHRRCIDYAAAARLKHRLYAIAVNAHRETQGDRKSTSLNSSV